MNWYEKMKLFHIKLHPTITFASTSNSRLQSISSLVPSHLRLILYSSVSSLSRFLQTPASQCSHPMQYARFPKSETKATTLPGEQIRLCIIMHYAFLISHQCAPSFDQIYVAVICDPFAPDSEGAVLVCNQFPVSQYILMMSSSSTASWKSCITEMP